MKWILLALIATGFAIIYGCAEKEQPQTTSAADLWKIISQEKPYKQRGSWPGVEGLMEGKAPHGKFIRTYANDIAVKAKGARYPYGSTIVKENYMPDTTLAKITVMHKVKGFNPEAGDWFWVIYSPDGTVEMEGNMKTCIACHSLREAND